MSTSTREEIRLGAITVRPLIEGADTGGGLAIHEFTVASGAGVPVAHSHDAYEETIYGVTGVLTWTLRGEVVEVGPGEVLHIPRGVVHHFDNPHEADATQLAIVTPGILGGDYFRAIAAVVAAAGGGPPDLAAIGEAMRLHGLTPAP